jgi:hypothetical protein
VKLIKDAKEGTVIVGGNEQGEQSSTRQKNVFFSHKKIN